MHEFSSRSGGGKFSNKIIISIFIGKKIPIYDNFSYNYQIRQLIRSKMNKVPTFFCVVNLMNYLNMLKYLIYIYYRYARMQIESVSYNSIGIENINPHQTTNLPILARRFVLSQSKAAINEFQ